MRLAILVAAMLCAGCSCWTAEHAQDPKCVVVHEIVDCTESGALSLLPSLIPLFTDLLSNQANIDGNAIETRLEAMGYKDGGCLLAALEAAFVGSPKASVETAKKAQSIHGLLVRWKQKHGTETVKFKVIGPNGLPTYQ
jgi:hypothetical protein